MASGADHVLIGYMAMHRPCNVRGHQGHIDEIEANLEDWYGDTGPGTHCGAKIEPKSQAIGEEQWAVGSI